MAITKQGYHGNTGEIVEEHKKAARLSQTRELVTHDLLDAYEEINRHPRVLTSDLEFGQGVKVVGEKELDAIMGETNSDRYERFHREYGESACLLSVSRVAFGADGSVAYSDFGFTVGGRHARGGFAILRRSGTRWIIVEVVVREVA